MAIQHNQTLRSNVCGDIALRLHEMFIIKYSLPGKNNFIPTFLHQNCGKNTGKVKEATLFQKYLGVLKKEIATCV